MNHLGYQVSRLIRVQFGPFKLNHLKPGEILEVDQGQIKKAFIQDGIKHLAHP
jgi:16S rRNA U516 pseudouridylate synthase RsuA-like enzyme